MHVYIKSKNQTIVNHFIKWTDDNIETNKWINKYDSLK